MPLTHQRKDLVTLQYQQRLPAIQYLFSVVL